MNRASLVGLDRDELLELAAQDYEHRLRAEHRTVNLKGAKISQKIKAILTLEVQKQLVEFSGMEACAGIRGNPDTAYKARENHYGGISSWGMLLPMRRWVDAAYSTVSTSGGGLGLHTSFDGPATKAIKEYLKRNIVSNIKSRPINQLAPSKRYTDTEAYNEYRREVEKKKSKINEAAYSDSKSENSIRKNAEITKIEQEYYGKMIAQANTPVNRGGRGMNVSTESVPYSDSLFGTWQGGKEKPKQPREVMRGLADKMRYNQLRAIDNMKPSNAWATIQHKGFDKPLVETGQMIASIQAWVTTKEGR